MQLLSRARTGNMSSTIRTNLTSKSTCEMLLCCSLLKVVRLDFGRSCFATLHPPSPSSYQLRCSRILETCVVVPCQTLGISLNRSQGVLEGALSTPSPELFAR